jgi:hypothetical protein
MRNIEATENVKKELTKLMKKEVRASDQTGWELKFPQHRRYDDSEHGPERRLNQLRSGVKKTLDKIDQERANERVVNDAKKHELLVTRTFF